MSNIFLSAELADQKPDTWDPVMIAELHQIRLKKFAKAKELSEDKAIHELIEIHRRGHNMAEYLSMTIGEDHLNYMQSLVRLGETAAHIR